MLFRSFLRLVIFLHIIRVYFAVNVVENVKLNNDNDTYLYISPKKKIIAICV